MIFLDFLEFFFADFSLVKNACKKPAEQTELAVPRSTGPGSFERNLDIAVRENNRNIFLVCNVDRFLKFGAGFHAGLCTHAFLVRAEHQVCNEGGELFFLDDISQVCIFPTIRVLDGLETSFVEFHADGVRGFVFDGLVNKIFGYLRNMGGSDEDNFPVVLCMDTVNVGFLTRYGVLNFFRLRMDLIHMVTVM